MNDTELQALALEAFVYAFPLHEMTRMRAATSPRKLPGVGFAGDGADSTLRWANCLSPRASCWAPAAAASSRRTTTRCT